MVDGIVGVAVCGWGSCWDLWGGYYFFVCVVKDGGGVGCLKILLGWGLVFFVGCAF